MKGIYQIKSLKTGKIYIGKSVELEKRFYKHLNPLRKGSHYNFHLQRHFNKYGEEDLEYSILEETLNLDRLQLSNREIYWIEHKKAYGNGNFNQTSGGESGGGLSLCRKIQLKNIETDEIREFPSLSEAGRQLKISPSDIHRLLEGERVNRLGIWTRIDHEYSFVKSWQKTFTLYHDEHGTITRNSMKDFAKEIGVTGASISNLLKGKFKSCKGWRITSNKPPENMSPKKNQRKFKIFHEIYGIYEGHCISDWAKIFNIKSPQGLCAVLNRRHKSCNGWTLFHQS